MTILTDTMAVVTPYGYDVAGKLRLEGKDYAVKDGDVFHFRCNI